MSFDSGISMMLFPPSTKGLGFAWSETYVPADFRRRLAYQTKPLFLGNSPRAIQMPGVYVTESGLQRKVWEPAGLLGESELYGM